MGGRSTTPRPDAWGSTDVKSVRIAGADVTSQVRFISPDDGNAADRTVMSLPLGTPVVPQADVNIEIEWTSRIPRPFARTGYIEDYYFLVHWFPKIGVLENTGWNTHQFHASTEFYADYGVYDVRMTVPSGGGATPNAISIASAAALEWTPPQTPQARLEMKIASRGSRPLRIIS